MQLCLNEVVNFKSVLVRLKVSQRIMLQYNTTNKAKNQLYKKVVDYKFVTMFWICGLQVGTFNYIHSLLYFESTGVTVLYCLYTKYDFICIPYENIYLKMPPNVKCVSKFDC